MIGRGYCIALWWMLAMSCACANQPAIYAPVKRGVALQFPRDHGSHPLFRTEWWYITGWLRGEDGRELGVQITFFRRRTGLQERNSSRFAPSQLLFAHAAIADPRRPRLLHDQRAGRVGFGLASARGDDTGVMVDGCRRRRVA